MDNTSIFDKSIANRKSNFFEHKSISIKKSKDILPEKFLRNGLDLPSLGELDVIRHYTRLSRKDFSLDANFYPLGSCTMKYNPKVNEDIANVAGFSSLHPYQDQNLLQGALELIYDLERLLCAISGMARFSFQTAAGAHGELAGMLMISAYHKVRKDKRYKVIIPDSAHGTNPATAAMCGYEAVVVKSNPSGLIDIDDLYRLVDCDLAAMMLTNPNTLGLFEERILDISDIVHKKGGVFYYDGANFNPLLGVVQPSQMGFDIIHFNLHKTFSTPHGSGGPGAAALGVTKDLAEFLPIPLVDKKGDKFYFNYGLKNTIGQIKAFYGNFMVLVKAYSYILRLGREGLRRVAENAVLNANYLREKLKNDYEPASLKRCMHEVVFSCENQKAMGVSALDIAKRLIDFSIHPPTMYFPLIVKEALMVEPTESESKETLDRFIGIMKDINNEIKLSPEKVTKAPLSAGVSRVDETLAARCPNVKWQEDGE
ncbi:MAG: aminomethyl-transferring glycine dehydrogenase subunit GcvPB [Candidatus Omnitrophota bacterium]